MALRAIMKRRELDGLTKQLAELREAENGFATREAELESAIAEIESDEERAAMDAEIEKFENERTANADSIKDLEGKIEQIETELAELERNQAPAEPAESESDTDTRNENKETTKRSTEIMDTRNIFSRMDVQRRDAIFARDDVQKFLGEVRAAMKNKRALTGAGLLTPEVFLGLIKENIENYSKLYKHLNVKQLNGKGREVVMGTIPEAVWTECCGNLNELALTFNDTEVDCFKLGGFFAVCNADLEDSDVNLAAELIEAIGQAIGYALDKAVAFGLGTRMPLGIFTRLAQTSKPADYPDTARTWTDLHTSNIVTIPSTAKGVDLFKAIVLATGAAKGKYSRGEKVWIMNDATYTKLQSEAMAIDASGAIVAGINGTMPVIGGIIEVLDFMPNDVIVGGYLDLYLLGERAGVTVSQSEHAKFIEDRTVFRGTARYDGQPVIAEGFVAIGIGGTTPSASGITFAPDVANASE